MNDLPRQKLVEIIAKYGKSLCDEPKRCEGLLRDFCGEYRGEVNVLISSLKERVATELLKTGDMMPVEIQLHRLTQRLQKYQGMSEEVAKWAVESWALALGVIDEPQEENTPSVTTTVQIPPITFPSPSIKSSSSPNSFLSRKLMAGVAALGLAVGSFFLLIFPETRITPLIVRMFTKFPRKVELLRTIQNDSGWVLSVALSPDGNTIVSGSRDNTIRIWDLSTGNVLQTMSGHSGAVRSVALSPDDKTIVSGSFDNTIKVWDLRTGNLLRTLIGHSDEVYSVAISPDGNTVVSGSNDKTIKVWNLRTGDLLRTLEGYSSSVNSIALSPDGNTIISGSDDKTIKVWDLRTGNLLRTLKGHTDSVNSIALSPDGNTIISGSDDKTIKVWGVP